MTEGTFIVRRPGLLAGKDRAYGEEIPAAELARVTSPALSALLEQGYLEHRPPLSGDAESELKRLAATVEQQGERLAALEARAGSKPTGPANLSVVPDAKDGEGPRPTRRKTPPKK